MQRSLTNDEKVLLHRLSTHPFLRTHTMLNRPTFEPSQYNLLEYQILKTHGDEPNIKLDYPSMSLFSNSARPNSQYLMDNNQSGNFTDKKSIPSFENFQDFSNLFDQDGVYNQPLEEKESGYKAHKNFKNERRADYQLNKLEAFLQHKKKKEEINSKRDALQRLKQNKNEENFNNFWNDLPNDLPNIHEYEEKQAKLNREKFKSNRDNFSNLFDSIANRYEAKREEAGDKGLVVPRKEEEADVLNFDELIRRAFERGDFEEEEKPVEVEPLKYKIEKPNFEPLEGLEPEEYTIELRKMANELGYRPREDTTNKQIKRELLKRWQTTNNNKK